MRRDRLEALYRYLLRPPLSYDRLEALPDGRYRLRLKTAWPDGTSHLVLSGHELLNRLAALVPAPRKNQLSYHGVLAARSSWRSAVLPQATGPPDGAHVTPAASQPHLGRAPPSRPRHRRPRLPEGGMWRTAPLRRRHSPPGRHRPHPGPPRTGAPGSAPAPQAAPWPARPARDVSLTRPRCMQGETHRCVLDLVKDAIEDSDMAFMPPGPLLRPRGESL
ncbi:MAG: transposase [Sandaracinaceae bacterium]